jgi:Asp-tRNA(Asn)/Glu-tRNA(Gln) amidotransferase A subunit family amidase
MYEATSSHGFGVEVKRRIMLGTYALSAGYYDQYYGTAQRARQRITGDFRRVFAAGVDVLFTPDEPVARIRARGAHRRSPGPDVPLGRLHRHREPGGHPGRLRADRLACDGLPLGGQVLAPWWEEERMLAVAGALERRARGGGRVSVRDDAPAGPRELGAGDRHRGARAAPHRAQALLRRPRGLRPRAQQHVCPVCLGLPGRSRPR